MYALHHPRSGSPAVTVVAGAVGVTAPWLLDQPSAVRSLLALVLAVAAVAAGVDAETGRLPDRYVAFCAAGAMALVALEALVGRGPDAVVASALGAAAFAGPIGLVHLAAPSAMGFGDVKFAAALGACLGVVDPVASVVALCLACAVTVLAAAVLRRTALAFGPGLAIGAALALVPIALTSSGATAWP